MWKNILYLLWFRPHPDLIQHIWNNATKSILHLPQITEQMKTWNEIELDFKLIVRLSSTDESILPKTSSPSFMSHCILNMPRQWNYCRAGHLLSYINIVFRGISLCFDSSGVTYLVGVWIVAVGFSLESSVQPSDPSGNTALCSTYCLVVFSKRLLSFPLPAKTWIKQLLYWASIHAAKPLHLPDFQRL